MAIRVFFEVLKCPPPLQCHVFCSIITYIRYIILWAPLHVCAGLSHHQTLFWDRCVNKWLIEWLVLSLQDSWSGVWSVSTDRACLRGCLLCVDACPPLLLLSLIYVFQYFIIVQHLTYVSDTGYQWAPLHVCVGLSHHQALFWDRWVNLDWIGLDTFTKAIKTVH